MSLLVLACSMCTTNVTPNKEEENRWMDLKRTNFNQRQECNTLKCRLRINLNKLLVPYCSGNKLFIWIHLHWSFTWSFWKKYWEESLLFKIIVTKHEKSWINQPFGPNTVPPAVTVQHFTHFIFGKQHTQTLHHHTIQYINIIQKYRQWISALGNENSQVSVSASVKPIAIDL